MRQSAVFLCLILVLGFPGARAFGQTGQQAGKKQHVQFTCMLWEGPLESQLFYRDGEQYVPVTPFTESRSKAHLLKFSKEFSLHVKHQVEEQEEAIYRLVGKSPLLTGTRRILFLLFKQEPEDGLEFRILPFDDSVAGFPAGTFRFMNMSPGELRVKFAAETRRIPAGKMTLMDSDVSSDGGLIPFLIGDSRGRRIFETRLFAQPTGREIVFIGPPKEGEELPSVRFLSQLLPRQLPTLPQEPEPEPEPEP